MKTNVLFFAVIFMVSCGKPSNTPTEVKEVAVIVAPPPADTIIDVVQQEIPTIQLVKKHSLSEKELYADFEGEDRLSDYFVVELIDKDVFLKNKAMAVDMIVIDTLAIQKEKGVLKLPCGKTEISFVDNVSNEENHKEYTYIGQIHLLNVYLLSGIYWEDWNYFFVDKNAGRTVQTFINRPYLSADGKYIVSIDVDPFEGATFLDLYEVSDNKNIDVIAAMSIEKWVPVNTPETMYWGNDNCLYLTVIHNKDYWQSDGNYQGLDQYIRLRPLVMDKA